MKISWLWHVTLFVISITNTGFACADVYAYTNEDGAIALSNVPTDNRYTLILISSPDENTHAIRTTLTASASTKAKPYANIVEEAARINKIDVALLHAVIATESSYNPLAVSIKGASGLMQLMPQTARRYGVNNRYDPSENIHGGARYLKDLLHLFNNDFRLALAAYNAGESTVAKFGNKVPPYRETAGYVNKVMELYSQNTISID